MRLGHLPLMAAFGVRMKPTGRQLALATCVLHGCVVMIHIVSAVATLLGFLQLEEGASLDSLGPWIAAAVYAEGLGFLLLAAGMVAELLAVWGAKYREHWFYRISWAISIFWLVHFPIGTVLGLVLMVFLKDSKSEFHLQSSAGKC